MAAARDKDDGNSAVERLRSLHGSDSEHAEELVRAELLLLVEAAKRNLEIELTELRRSDVPNLQAIDRAEDRIRRLDALRDQVTNAAGGIALAGIRSEVGAAVTASAATVLQTSAAASAAAGYATAQLYVSRADYQRSAAELDTRAAAIHSEVTGHFAYAEEAARLYGIDITAQLRTRDELEREREKARREGDILGERQAEALLARNAFNTLAVELDGITDPQARQRHVEELAEARRTADEARANLAAQAELEARRMATERAMPPDQAKAFIEGFKRERLDALERLAGALPGADKGAAVAAGQDHPPPETAPTTATLGSVLPADAQAGVEEAAAAIRQADKQGDAGFTFGDSGSAATGSPAASKIALDNRLDAHTTVEAPKVPTKDKAAGVTI